MAGPSGLPRRLRRLPARLDCPFIRRQPRGGRVAPRAGPSRGLRGQTATQPLVHFYAAAPVHFYDAVDSLLWYR